MLDDIDREAMREGSAMSRSRSYSTGRKSKVIIRANDRKSVPKVKEPDILSILNIVQGPLYVEIKLPGTTNRV